MYNLPVDLSLVDETTLIAVLRNVPFHLQLHTPGAYNALLERVPKHTALRFICTVQSTVPVPEIDAFEYAELPVRVRESKYSEFGKDQDFVFGVMHPDWLSVIVDGQGSLSLPNERGCEGPYLDYLRSLVSALLTPNDADLYFVAAEASAHLPEQVTWPLGFRTISGPSPNDFRCVEDWISFKAATRLFFADEKSLDEIEALCLCSPSPDSVDECGWVALLFHPLAWDLLVKEGLLAKERVDRLRTTVWGKLAALPRVLVEIGTYFSDQTQFGLRFPLARAYRVAIALHKEGRNHEMATLWRMVRAVDVSMITQEEVDSIFDEIDPNLAFPPSWGAFLISVALRIEDIQLAKVSALWEQLHRDGNDRIWTSELHTIPVDQTNGIIRDLLKLHNIWALDLAITVFQSRSVGLVDSSVEINRRSSLGLKDVSISDTERTIYLRGLSRSRATLEKARVICGSRNFQLH